MYSMFLKIILFLSSYKRASILFTMIWIIFAFSILGSTISISENLIMMKNGRNISPKNLTSIRWAHAVNSKKELEEAVHGNIDMIEADVVLGKLLNDVTEKIIPIMGHPPQNISDLSLLNFLEIISKYNNNNKNKMIGVKLDFKSIEVFKGSEEILKATIPLMNYPIWLNADILNGPIYAPTKPVDAKQFLDGCRQFNSAILSIGWTTMWGSNYTKGSYNEDHIKNMISCIKDNKVTHNITFPVRAGIAALSIDQLQILFNDISKTNNVTFTIWSSKNDAVDIKKLRSFIFKFGIDKVYIDVPQELLNELYLNDFDNSSAISTMAMSLIYVVILSTASIFLHMWL